MKGISPTWEEETLARLRYAEEQRRLAEDASGYWTRYAEALETILELDRQRRLIDVDGQFAVDPERLRATSVRKALMEIAVQKDGLLVMRDAIEILLQAGRFKDRTEARNTLYSTLSHAKRYFRKERPGLYCLAQGARASSRPEPETPSVTGPQPPAD